MPFQKDNKLAKGHGRKGYEIEKKQLDQMKRIIGKYLNIIEKELDGKADYKDVMKLENARIGFNKAMDKVHASKSDMKVEVEKPIMIL